ncbi:MAG: type IX secretion system sortase PorU [Bacteroidales bacterium]|nr:type IX secretion system sortase PorU [Bacteroidales bacterium]
MKKYFILLILGATLSISIQAQTIMLNWENTPASAFNEFPMNFTGAYTSAAFADLPVYQQQMPGEVHLFRIVGDVWEIVPASLDLKNWENLIPDSLVLQNEIMQIRDQHSLLMTLVPLRKSSDGSIERLISFQMEKTAERIDMPLKSKHVYLSESVLSNGDWYKLSIEKSGIYKITADDLTAYGVDISKINPKQIGIYSMGGGSLPEKNADVLVDDLPQIAIRVMGEEDGLFNANDYILFYGQGPVIWKYNSTKGKFSHVQNHYNTRSYYFLNTSTPDALRIGYETLSTLPESARVNSYMGLYLHENDSLCPTKTGKVWLGEVFQSTEPQVFSFSAPDVVSTMNAHLELSVAGRASQENKFFLYYQNEKLLQVNFNGIAPSQMNKYYARPFTAYRTYQAKTEGIKLELNYEWPNNTSVAWLDYIEMNVPRYLTYRGGQFPFNYLPPNAGNHLPEITISGNSSGALIWRVDNHQQVKSILTQYTNGKRVFKMLTTSAMEFIAFEPESAFSPEFVGVVANQNLHGLESVDMIIIAPEIFHAEANRLAALHLMHDGLSSLVVAPDKIYNEFSGGALDPGGLRSFIRMLYQKAPAGKMPRFVLLFGEGSYDPKDRLPNNVNYIPAFQSDEGLTVVNSFVCDDYYGLMDDNEGVDGSGGIDLGVGRFPVSTVEQAKLMVDKVETYLSQNGLTLADWRNKICFLADDQDNNTHLEQAETLSMIADTADVNLNVNKIYFDAYRQSYTSSGQAYPDASYDLNQQVQNGALLVNYTGHGGEFGWSGEGVLTVPDIMSWSNQGRLPVFVTATCEFSRFDDPALVSAGELVLVKGPEGGAALFTTTRLAYSTTNFYLNRAFYKALFTPVGGGKPHLGDLVRIAKNEVNNNDKIRNFVLLGDPALAPAFPANRVVVTHVNGQAAEAGNDTLRAMDKAVIKGKICTRGGEFLNNFTGQMSWKMYDKKEKLRTLANDPESYVQNFYLRGKIVSEGRVMVNKGEFEIRFIVPRDIDLTFGEGKLSMYATDTITDAAGGFTGFVLGGTSTQLIDSEGPDITLYVNGPGFKDGVTISPDATLFVILRDSSGINYSGLGIGHHIALDITDAPSYQDMNLNGYFEAFLDDYTGGMIELPLKDLPEGPHSLTIRAWDINNNSSLKTIHFLVAKRYDIDLYDVKNSPNPFNNQTYFSFKHNKAGVTLNIEIVIYNLQGYKVKTIQRSFSPSGYGIPPIGWDGSNDGGTPLSAGMYIYQIRVQTLDGSRGETSSKLFKFN